MATITKKAKGKKQSDDLSVTVRTMVNGYMLEVNNDGYMYFNARSLVEGFCVHVGMKRLTAMTQEEIRDFLEATKDGSLCMKLQDEVSTLTTRIEELKEKIKKQKKEINELKRYYV